MNTTATRKIATVLGAGSLLVGAAIAAPAASAATPTTTLTAAAPAAADLQAAGPRTALVAAWYQDFLGRSASDDPGSNYWVVQLRDVPPVAVLAQFLSSTEYTAGQVSGYYTDLLGRSTEGDPAADYWYGGLARRDFPPEWVEQNILASAEYESRAAGDAQRAPQRLVQSWYRDVLGREANAGEVQYWSLYFEANPAGDVSNLEVLRTIWYTPEAVAHRVAGHFETFLDRAPNAGEVSYWSGIEATSDLDAQLSIATTAEYQKLSGQR